MSMLSGFKWAFHCCSRVHHLPWAVGSYVIGQEIYSICVTKELMEIQVFQYLTLCYSKCLRNNQWNSSTSQNCFPSNTASYPRITSSGTVSHHKTTSLVTQCYISEPLTQWHSITSQKTWIARNTVANRSDSLVFVREIWIIHFWLNLWHLKSSQRSL